LPEDSPFIVLSFPPWRSSTTAFLFYFIHRPDRFAISLPVWVSLEAMTATHPALAGNLSGLFIIEESL
jgi:hypothetical protein